MAKSRSVAPIIAAVLLLLPVLYVVSYVALVTPHRPYGVVIMGGLRRPVYPYRYGRGVAAKVFWPLEQIDRKLRPEAWNPMNSGDGFNWIGVDFGP